MARSLSGGLDGKTARHDLDLLEGLYLVRSVPAWSRNAGKRLVKAPTVYWRDSGLLHALAGLHDLDQVSGHPLCGHSWEGYCIEQIVPRLPTGTAQPLPHPRLCRSRSRTRKPVRRNERPRNQAHSLAQVDASILENMKTLHATKGYDIISHGDSYPLSKSVTAISLTDYLARLPWASVQWVHLTWELFASVQSPDPSSQSPCSNHPRRPSS